ncbi:MAG: hypothetical protein P8Y97_13000, partial [Candidatus Lokiarchaeota archaeon]
MMVWPYRKSLHFIQDQCLKLKNSKVPNLKKVFKKYHQNITEKLPWWKNLVNPNIKLRAKLWQCFEIYVGIDEPLNTMPKYDNGIILIGDAAGLESTELCDGVPSAWFSAEIAANVATSAITQNNLSAKFMNMYDQKIKDHSIIQWSISGKNRFNLRYAQERHDEILLKNIIHNGWGLGALTHFTVPFLKLFLKYFKNDKFVVKEWILMFFRYFQNWLFNSYGETEQKIRKKQDDLNLKNS